MTRMITRNYVMKRCGLGALSFKQAALIVYSLEISVDIVTISCELVRIHVLYIQPLLVPAP